MPGSFSELALKLSELLLKLFQISTVSQTEATVFDGFVAVLAQAAITMEPHVRDVLSVRVDGLDVSFFQARLRMGITGRSKIFTPAAPRRVSKSKRPASFDIGPPYRKTRVSLR
jgi:hypothetical protein